MRHENRAFVDRGGTLYSSNLITHPVQLAIRREDLIDREIQVCTYSFIDVQSNTIFGYAYNWEEVIDRLNSMMENCTEWQRIEAIVRLKLRVNAQA